MKIYVVLSTTQDECSCSNRAFVNYEAAYKYMRVIEANNVCEYYIIGVELEEDNELLMSFQPSA